MPPYQQWALDLLTKADYDEYWQHPSYAPALFWDDFPDVPILIIGGWYDSYTRSTCKNYEGLSARKQGPVRMLMGPWTHGTQTPEQSFAGDAEFGEDSALDDFRDLHLRYFDWALKGVDNGEANAPPVQIFAMGGGGGYRTSSGRLFHGGHWRDEAEWPLARTRYHQVLPARRRHLVTARTSRRRRRYSLSLRSRQSSAFHWRQCLVACGDRPTAAGRGHCSQCAVAGADGAIDGAGRVRSGGRAGVYGCAPPYLPLGSRPDVLVFTTEPLAEDVEVTGPIEVRLWVSSSAPDTDFTAKLIDCYPPSRWYPHGYALNLTDSIARLRYRNGREKGELLAPDEVAELTITLYPTSNVFATGHQIRLDISSSNFPRFDVNPNTGDPIGQERRRQGADNRIHHNAAQASHVVLPIIPTRRNA